MNKLHVVNPNEALRADVIDSLKHMLAEAEQGKFVAIAIVAMQRSGSLETNRTREIPDKFAFSGQLLKMAMDVLG